MKTTLQFICVVSALLLSATISLSARTARKDVTVVIPGTLGNMLGDSWNQIDSLVVAGSINVDDIKTSALCINSGWFDQC